jgi:hypothetical protein
MAKLEAACFYEVPQTSNNAECKNPEDYALN